MSSSKYVECIGASQVLGAACSPGPILRRHRPHFARASFPGPTRRGSPKPLSKRCLAALHMHLKLTCRPTPGNRKLHRACQNDTCPNPKQPCLTGSVGTHCFPRVTSGPFHKCLYKGFCRVAFAVSCKMRFGGPCRVSAVVRGSDLQVRLNKRRARSAHPLRRLTRSM